MFRRIINPIAWGGVITVVVVLIFSSWGMSQKVISVPNDTYEGLKIFSDVLSIVQNDYTEEKETKELIYSAVKGMLEDLDPHSSFLTPEEYKDMQIDTKGVFGGLGIEIGMKDGVLTVVAPIEDTPASRAGVLAGDRIVKIEDKFTNDMTLNDAVKLMRGAKGTKITIHIMREGFTEPRPFVMMRDIIKVKSVKSKVLDDEFGYIRLAGFQENTSEELEKAIKSFKTRDGAIKGLILDMRNNPGGLLQEAVNVSNLFLDSGVIVSTRGREKSQDMVFRADSVKTQPNYPIIVIVNGGSASAAEIVAGALQDHKRAVVLGTPTFGKGSVQTIIPLSDGSAVRLTTSKYYTPSGRSIQAKGIEPDIVVGEEAKEHIKEKDLTGHLDAEADEKKPEGLKIIEGNSKTEDGEDVQLKRALDYLKSWYIFKETTGRTNKVG